MKAALAGVIVDSTLQTELMRVAHLLADAARKETLALFRTTGLEGDNKAATSGGYDPVTAADRASEAAMRAILERERPQDGILGEEFGTQAGDSGLTWVLDPIDGTRGFVSGIPTWGVLISVADATGPIYGLIDQPYIGERFEGGFGRADLVGPTGAHPLTSRAHRSLEQATLISTFPEVGSPDERAAFERVRDAVRLTRYGTDCYGYALLAAGQVDLVIEAGLLPYDIHAPICVVRAAGGIITDWQGGDPQHGGRVIAASTPETHAAALALLQDGLSG